MLPLTGWTWQETVGHGWWNLVGAVPVDIPATMGLEGGVWFAVRQGIHGLFVHDEQGRPVVFMLCEPASYYYQVMTRSARMPVLIGERI